MIAQRNSRPAPIRLLAICSAAMTLAATFTLTGTPSVAAPAKKPMPHVAPAAKPSATKPPVTVPSLATHGLMPPTPQTQAEINRYNQYVTLFNTGAQLYNQAKITEALAKFDAAYTLWPNGELAEHIADALGRLEQWPLLTQRLAQWPRQGHYLAVTQFYQARLNEDKGITFARQQQWQEGGNLLQQARRAYTTVPTTSHYGSDARDAIKRIDENLELINANLASIQAQTTVQKEATEHHQQLVKTIIAQESIPTSGGASIQTGKEDFVWNTAYFPIRVYLQPAETVDGFDPSWTPLAERALHEWQQKSAGTVVFKTVPTEAESDITLRWIDHFSRPDASGDKLDKHGITHIRTLNGMLHNIDIEISTHLPSGGKPSEALLYSVLLHEVGHAIGMSRHSEQPDDIMNPVLSNDADRIPTRLSVNDLRILKQLYLTSSYQQNPINYSWAARRERDAVYNSLLEAHSLMQQEKFKKALPLLTQADALAPNTPAILVALAQCYSGRKDTEALKQTMVTLITHHPSRGETYLVLGLWEDHLAEMAFDKTNWQEAIAHYGNTIRYYSQVPETSAYHSQAQSYMKTARANIGIARENTGNSFSFKRGGQVGGGFNIRETPDVPGL